MLHFIQKNNKYFNAYFSLGAFALFLFFIIVVLPRESTQSLALGLDVSPDTSIFYTASRLYEIAESYGIEGRRFYIHQRFTFDLLWPIGYGLFIFVSSVFFFKHLNLPKVFYRFLWLPVLAVGFDYLENLMTALVMFRFPYKTYFFDMLAGVMTLFKWITLSMSFIMLFVWIALYLYNIITSKNHKEAGVI